MASQRRSTRKATQSRQRNESDGDEQDNDVSSNAQDLAKDMAQYLITSMDSKGVVKEPDMKKLFGSSKTTYAQAMKLLPAVLKAPGLHLVNGPGGKMYVVNKVAMRYGAPDLDDDDRHRSILEDAKHGVLLAVLSFMQMSRNPLADTNAVTDTQLWEFLGGLGLDEGGRDATLGDLSKLIGPSHTAEWVQKGWIEWKRVEVGNGEPDQIVYQWGPRAVATVCPMQMLTAFCDINGDDRPESWKDYYTDAKEKQKYNKDKN